MKKNSENLKERYDNAISVRSEYESVWQDIADFVGIQVATNYIHSPQQKGDVRDTEINDPTAALAVNQAGDYLQGILWGTGDEVITLEPSDWVLQRAKPQILTKYYDFRTNQLLKNMNHSRSGFNTALKSYFYDQVAFGTSGIGVFKNQEYLEGQEDVPYVFRSYGVDNFAIDEGKNGLVDVVFVVYRWRVNRIVSEFEEVYDTLPDKIKKAFNENNLNEEFSLVHAIFPRKDYHPKYKGKRGAKYKGAWFLEDDESKVFFEEDYRTLPIGVCRAIKLRGEIYGRSSGSLLISSIKSADYILGKTIEILEKMASPSLGIWNNALFGDSVLDTSADGVVTFNQSLMGGSQVPVFPIHDIGDPTGIIKFLLPYLNEKIATGFKIDILLDFSSAKDMTATESMQRYNIRGKSLGGILQQQKIEMFEVVIHRCVQLEDDMNLAGVNPTQEKDLARIVEAAGNAQIIVPDAVAQAMKEGKQWYKIKFNNELDRLSKTQAMERVIQSVNAIMMIGQAFPKIVDAVEWYKIWADVNKYLGVDYIKDEEEFKAILIKQMEMQQGAMQMQAMQVGAETGKNIAQGKKHAAEAKQIDGGTPN